MRKEIEETVLERLNKEVICLLRKDGVVHETRMLSKTAAQAVRDACRTTVADEVDEPVETQVSFALQRAKDNIRALRAAGNEQDAPDEPTAAARREGETGNGVPFYAASPPCCPPLTRIWSATTGSSQIAPGTARHCHIRQPGLRTLGVTTTPPGIASPQMSRSPQNPRSFENVPTCHGHACCIAPCMSTHFPVPGAPRPWSYWPF